MRSSRLTLHLGLPAVLTALALAACGGSSNSASSTQAAQTGAGQTSASSASSGASQATGSGTASATATGASTTATTSGSGGAALAGTARESTCATSALQLSFVSGQGAAGTAYMTYALTNVGPRTCTLYGYPGVSITDASGSTVQHPAERGVSQAPPTHVSTVTLAHGSAARFLVSSSNVIPSPGCPHAFTGTTLRVYPPNQRQALTMPHSSQFCNLHVGPVEGPH